MHGRIRVPVVVASRSRSRGERKEVLQANSRRQKESRLTRDLGSGRMVSSDLVKNGHVKNALTEGFGSFFVGLVRSASVVSVIQSP